MQDKFPVKLLTEGHRWSRCLTTNGQRLLLLLQLKASGNQTHILRTHLTAPISNSNSV